MPLLSKSSPAGSDGFTSSHITTENTGDHVKIHFYPLETVPLQGEESSIVLF
jgi:hypothetical protein